jgi:flavin reductase (DIM6/NTAB) family NADH-FMN oxidoreductase RutF
MLERIATHDRKPNVDGRRFRMGLGAFATGVTIVTTGRGDFSYGMTASAVASVSLEPPLILVCVDRRGRAAREIARNAHFVVNVLGADQEHLSRYFASPDRPRGRDGLRGVPHRLTASGAVVLEDIVAHLECTLAASHEAGDHIIFVGEVVELSVDGERPPLLVHRSRYRRLMPLEAA